MFQLHYRTEDFMNYDRYNEASRTSVDLANSVNVEKSPIQS
jgi:hypothetical protein